MSKYEQFDRSRLKLKPLAERRHDLHIDHWLNLDDAAPPFEHPDLATVASRIRAASGRARILMMGAHVLRAGVNRHLIDLIERGTISHIAVNGACAIHDYELARIGSTTESVERYIQSGEFGLWSELAELNGWIAEAARDGYGLGENVGRRIEQSDFPHRGLSVFAAAWRHSIPVTVHVGIGYDILHEHPSCDGAAVGAASYRDFLIFARSVQNLEGGVLLNFGSAIMGPEVYLKALAISPPLYSTSCRSRATTGASFNAQIPDIISARTRRSWCERSKTAGRASTSAVRTERHFPRCGVFCANTGDERKSVTVNFSPEGRGYVLKLLGPDRLLPVAAAPVSPSIASPGNQCLTLAHLK